MKKEIMLKELKQKRQETEQIIGDSALDFVNNYYFENINYLSDSFSEFADSNTSIYCYDQRAYYYDHTEQCDNALLSLYCADDIAEMIRRGGLDDVICKAGACGEYDSILNDLYIDEEYIKILLVIDYIINCIDFNKLDVEEFSSTDEAINNFINDIK